MYSALMPETYKLDIPVNLIRLSVGLEYVEDILADLDYALRAAVNFILPTSYLV